MLKKKKKKKKKKKRKKKRQNSQKQIQILQRKKERKKQDFGQLQAIEYQLDFNFNSGLGIKQKKYSIYLKNVVTKFSNSEDSIYLACEYHKIWLYKVK